MTIDFPGLREAMEAHQKALQVLQGGMRGFAVASGYRPKSALQGFAARYLKPAWLNGGVHVFDRHAFRDAIASKVDVRCEHENYSFGLDGLELIDSPEGLAFRVPVPDTLEGYKLQGMVRSLSKADVSVGCRILSSERREIEGADVRIVTKAHLEEISLVKSGAVPYSYASVVDPKGPSLAECVKNGSLAIDGSLQELLRALNDLQRTMKG